MNTTARRLIAFAALFALGIAAGIGADRLWRARTAAEAAEPKPAGEKPAVAGDDEEPEPAAVVRTAIAAQGSLERTVDGLGAAASPPGASSVETWPTDLVVTRVFAQPGETVSKDAPLLQVAVTRDAETQMAAARLALETTAKSLELAQQRLDRGLATRPEVLTAQSAHEEALQRLERLRASLPPADGLLRAHHAGVVVAMHAQPGGMVAAGTPIVEISSGVVVAQIGIDPAEATGLAVGQSFDIRPIDDRAGGRWAGTLSLMAPALNPTTRLIDATLTLTGEALPRLGTPLRAKAAVSGASGVIIPRAALVPDGDEMIVFVVRDGTAVRTPVVVAQRGDDQVVLAGGCAAGDRVVVSGQGQLSGGAVVREVTSVPKSVSPDGGPGADH